MYINSLLSSFVSKIYYNTTKIGWNMHIAILNFISLLCQEPHPQFPPPTSLIVQGGSSKSMNDCQRHLGKTKSMKNRSKEECSPCFWSWDQHMLLLSHAFCEFYICYCKFSAPLCVYVTSFRLLILGCQRKRSLMAGILDWKAHMVT